MISCCCFCSGCNDFSCSEFPPCPPVPKIDMKEGNTAGVAEFVWAGMVIDREIEIDLLLCGGKAERLRARPSGLTGEYF